MLWCGREERPPSKTHHPNRTTHHDDAGGDADDNDDDDDDDLMLAPTLHFEHTCVCAFLFPTIFLGNHAHPLCVPSEMQHLFFTLYSLTGGYFSTPSSNTVGKWF